PLHREEPLAPALPPVLPRLLVRRIALGGEGEDHAPTGFRPHVPDRAHDSLECDPFRPVPGRGRSVPGPIASAYRTAPATRGRSRESELRRAPRESAGAEPRQR